MYKNHFALSVLLISWLTFSAMVGRADNLSPGAFRIDGQEGAYPASKNSSVGAPEKKGLTLYGRIEEISGSPGAHLPVELKALTPRMDQTGKRPQMRGQLESSSLKNVLSFPVDWRGSWTGMLKVHATEFSQLAYRSDPDETRKKNDLLRPGVTGEVGFQFEDVGGHLALEPTQVVFTAPGQKSRYADMLGQMLGGNGAALDPQSKALMDGILSRVPMIFALHLGDLSQGTGVTGNVLNSRLMKNDVKQLSAGVLEEDVVTYDADRNPSTGVVNNYYTESVLRFYRQSSNQLYVQAAIVSYSASGQFVDKIVMYGPVHRGQPRSMDEIINGSLFQGLTPQ